jgi:hypothetical protein
VVDPEDVQVFLSTKSGTQFAPDDVYEDFVATSKPQEGERVFDNTRFQLNVLRWLVIGQQPFLEAESDALQRTYDECNAQAQLKSRTSYHRLLLKILDLERQKLRDLLRQHKGLFNFTCDCWSDTEQEEFLGTSSPM